MAYKKSNPNGQATMANSEPVVIASNQSAVPVSATDLDIRNLINTDVVTAELSAVDNAVLDTIAAKDFATQTTLSAINAKLVSGTDIGDVTINNSTGASAVNIQDGGNSITVDGTVAVTNAGITTIAGAVSGTEMQVDILTIAAGDNNIGNVDIASALPSGSNAIGKLAANSGIDIGDVDVLTCGAITPGTGATNLGKAEDASHSSGDVGVMALAVRDDDPVVATSGSTGDYEALHTDARGILWSRNVPDTTDLANLGGEHVSKYYTNAGAVTDGIVWSPAAGKRWFITDIFIQVSAAATVTLEDDKSGGDAAVWKAELAANSGWSHSFKTPLFSGEDAADLIITTSAGNVYVTVTGYEI